MADQLEQTKQPPPGAEQRFDRLVAQWKTERGCSSDVAEMSMAVALGLDWTAGDLPEEAFNSVQTALIEKGLKTDDGSTRFVGGTNNWNQVCNGGMIAAAASPALTTAANQPFSR